MANLELRQWNYAATMAAIVVIASNIVGGWLAITGKISWTDYASTIGVLNGTTAGWVTRGMQQNSGS